MLQRSTITSLLLSLTLVGAPSFCANDDSERFLIKNPEPYKGLKLKCCLNRFPCGHDLKLKPVGKANKNTMQDLVEKGVLQKERGKDGQDVCGQQVGNVSYTTDVDSWKIMCDNCGKKTYATYKGQRTYTYGCKKNHDICLTCLDEKLKKFSDEEKKQVINITNDNPHHKIIPIKFQYEALPNPFLTMNTSPLRQKSVVRTKDNRKPLDVGDHKSVIAVMLLVSITTYITCSFGSYYEKESKKRSEFMDVA